MKKMFLTLSSVPLATYTYKFRCFTINEVQNSKLNLAMFLTSWVVVYHDPEKIKKVQEKKSVSHNLMM